MHICFITNEYPMQGHSHGGVGTFIKTISSKLIEGGHAVSIIGMNFYTNVDIEEEENGIKITRLKPTKIKGLGWWFNFRKINKAITIRHEQSPIDIVESAELGLAFINKLKSIKYVIRLHGGHHFFAESENRGINWWKGYQERRSFTKADGFIAVSDYVKSHTEKYLSYGSKPITKIRYPINLNLFYPRTDVSVKKNTILFAGTVCEKKGIHKLIEALSKVITSNPKVELFIYGRDWFFPNGDSYINYLKTQIIPKYDNLEDHIHFKGAVSLNELAIKYAEAEICVFPSLMETQGLVAPEAMAMEKLVIFSELGPGKETIIHQKTGLLCNPYNSSDIANQILWAMEHPKKVQHITKTGREAVLKSFNSDNIVNENIDFYTRIINN